MGSASAAPIGGVIVGAGAAAVAGPPARGGLAGQGAVAALFAGESVGHGNVCASQRTASKAAAENASAASDPDTIVRIPVPLSILPEESLRIRRYGGEFDPSGRHLCCISSGRGAAAAAIRSKAA